MRRKERSAEQGLRAWQGAGARAKSPLFIQVVDRRGAPVSGVPVALRATSKRHGRATERLGLYKPPPEPGETGAREILWHGRSAAPEGMAAVQKNLHPGGDYQAFFPFPLARAVEQSFVFDPRRPGRALRLTLPEVRRVVVHGVNDLLACPGARWKVRLGTKKQTSPVWETIAPGGALTLFTGARARVFLQAWLDLPFADLHSLEIPEGSKDAEEVVLRASKVYSCCQARVLDSRYRVLRSFSLHATLTRERAKKEPAIMEGILQPDGMGRIRFLVGKNQGRYDKSWLTLEVREAEVGATHRSLFRSRWKDHPADRQCRIELPPLEDGASIIELGDLRLGTRDD